MAKILSSNDDGDDVDVDDDEGANGDRKISKTGSFTFEINGR